MSKQKKLRGLVRRPTPPVAKKPYDHDLITHLACQAHTVEKKSSYERSLVSLYLYELLYCLTGIIQQIDLSANKQNRLLAIPKFQENLPSRTRLAISQYTVKTSEVTSLTNLVLALHKMDSSIGFTRISLRIINTDPNHFVTENPRTAVTDLEYHN